MKKFTSIVLCALSVLMLALPCVSCDNDKRIELIIKVYKEMDLNSIAMPEIKSSKNFLDAVSEEFAANYGKPVKITVMEYETGEEMRAITNTFGTSNATDILMERFFDMSSYIHTGNAIPLDDVLTAEQTADLYPAYYESGCLNGKLYMLPYKASQNVLIYNKNLMRDCGLDEFVSDTPWKIQSWTMEQWTNILDTLADKLPTGGVPTMMYAKDNQGDTHIMTLMRAFGSEIFNERNEFALTDEKTIEALRWIQNGVNRGWYMYTPYNKTIMDNNSKFKMDELVFYNFNLSSSEYADVTAPSGSDKYGFVNYPGNNYTTFCDGFEIFDNGDSQKIEVAKDFLRYIYNTDKWLECSAGNIPASMSVARKYADDIFLLKEFEQNTATSVDFFRNLPNWQGDTDSVRNVFYKEIANLLMPAVKTEFLITPEQCAARLNEQLNAAINRGRAESAPHN